jgi:hypothetical protein
VAWVKSVNKNSSGAVVSLTIREMNYGDGLGKSRDFVRPYTSKTATNGIRGMTFIYAP